VFHICTADGAGGLAQYSFLCPNGTVFNQNYFICDWWFNFDCAEAEGLYSLNDQYAAERDALAGDARDAQAEYVSGYGAPPVDAARDAQADYAAPAAADAGYAAPAAQAEYVPGRDNGYAAPTVDAARLRTGRQRSSGRGNNRRGF